MKSLTLPFGVKYRHDLVVIFNSACDNVVLVIDLVHIRRQLVEDVSCSSSTT